MKKIFYFVPAILMTAYYGGIVCGAGLPAVEPAAWAGVALLWGGSILLSRRVIWGAFCGALPGLMLIYQSMQDTSQLLRMELPLGIALLVYYMFCVCALYQRG